MRGCHIIRTPVYLRKQGDRLIRISTADNLQFSRRVLVRYSGSRALHGIDVVVEPGRRAQNSVGSARIAKLFPVDPENRDCSGDQIFCIIESADTEKPPSWCSDLKALRLRSLACLAREPTEQGAELLCRNSQTIKCEKTGSDLRGLNSGTCLARLISFI